ncbi:hypothetical protein F5X98DRAFT_372471 [Xylaria grammica]|nr:hypothetical protein F5X98DRAFT_372471 [Xylaria grammica]
MGSKNLESGFNANGTSAALNLDIWYLILDQIDSRKDLCNICLTSRAWYTMAIPHLYKTVTLAMVGSWLDWDMKSDRMEVARSLSSRLLDPKNEQLRQVVHELDFGRFGDDDDDDDVIHDMEKRLVALVHCLPNLQRVKIQFPPTDETLRQLTEHGKSISLYLFCEDGKRHVENKLQNVVAIRALVDPFDESEGPNRHVLGIQKLMFACPNLKSFSFETSGGYGGCVIRLPWFEQIYSFQFSGDETFPPLEELSLSGYRPSEDEWEHWQRKFPWSTLRSLTLGPRYAADFLDLAVGYTTSLRNLTVEIYTDEDRKSHCPQLTKFLRTFGSLESLTVKGYTLPLEPIGQHPGLKHLCLHSFEPARGDIQRPTLGVEQLRELDKSCAHLETLELDLYRDGEWPEHILKTLATGFKNLRRLTLHLELGLRQLEGQRTSSQEENMRIKPILTEGSAREVGQQFFTWSSLSKVGVLVLKTGEPLRRYPQWEPSYCRFERRHAETIEVYRPSHRGGVPEVAVTSRPDTRY